MQAILDTIPVGLYIVEANGAMVLANEESQRMWAGSAPLEHIHDYDKYVARLPGRAERLKAEEWPAAQALLFGRKTRDLAVDIERFDGTRGSLLFSAAPVKDAEGHVAGAVIATQDISELKEAQARLQEADRRKNEFLAVLSHELRNPLAPIRNSVYILERAAPGGEQAAPRAGGDRPAGAAHWRGWSTTCWTSRASRQGKIRLQRERLDLNELVRRSAEDHRADVRRGGDRASSCDATTSRCSSTATRRGWPR